MPRIDKSVLKSSSGSFPIGSERTVSTEALLVPVFAEDASLFVGFVGEVYDSIEASYLSANGDASVLPFTKDELVKYAFTGMRSRLARVNDETRVTVGAERFSIRCDDPWQMPAILASVLNSIGRVSLENPIITMYPVWNAEYDQYVMTRSEWHRVTQLLRGVSRNQYMKIVLTGLSGDKSGDDMLLSLIPVRDQLGRIVQIGHRNVPVDPIAAAVYVIAGFAPEIYAGVTLDLHALLLPTYYVEVGALRQNLWRLSDVA